MQVRFHPTWRPVLLSLPLLPSPLIGFRLDSAPFGMVVFVFCSSSRSCLVPRSPFALLFRRSVVARLRFGASLLCSLPSLSSWSRFARAASKSPFPLLRRCSYVIGCGMRFVGFFFARAVRWFCVECVCSLCAVCVSSRHAIRGPCVVPLSFTLLVSCGLRVVARCRL